MLDPILLIGWVGGWLAAEVSTQFTVERMLLASLVAVAALIALPIGAALGIYLHPPQRVTAAVMAFGSGALVEALAVDLAFEGAERLVHEHSEPAVLAWLYVAAGFVVGGLMFYGANRVLESRGGALRKQATTKTYLQERKREEAAEILSHLARVELLRSLPPEEIEELLPHVHPTRVKAGEVIFRAGDRGDALYMVDEGKIEILSRDVDLDSPRPANGLPVLATLTSGDSFGEIALLTDEPRTASAVAVEDGRLLRIDKNEFDMMVLRSPALREAVQQLNLERLLRSAREAPPADVNEWQRLAASGIRRVGQVERAAFAREIVKEHGSAPLAIFLGTLLDGIPECIVIGSSFISLATFSPGFVIAVFLNNLPEAMSSAVGMVRAGFSRPRILALWGSLVVGGAVFAMIGNAFLADAPATLTVFVNAIAGGGILAMLAATMMPEAFEEGGPVVGLATIVGFLSAFFFTVQKFG